MDTPKDKPPVGKTRNAGGDIESRELILDDDEETDGGEGPEDGEGRESPDSATTAES